jgi:hypoxanthine phosphoribosyltransferase
MAMRDDIKEILLTDEQIAARIKELAEALTADYKNKNPIVICILKGAAVFMTDLIRQLDFPLEIDCMSVSSYGAGTISSGIVRIIKDLDATIKDRDMLIVEDILDTGLTLDYLIRTFEERMHRSIKICALLIKEKNDPDMQMRLNVDYVGFRIKDEFVVGYGLDYNEHYRNLPYIGILKESVYKGTD